MYVVIVIGIFYAPVREKIRLGYMMWRYPTVPQSEIMGKTIRRNFLENGWHSMPNSRLIKIIDDVSAEVMLQDGTTETRHIGEVMFKNANERTITVSNSGIQKTLTIPQDTIVKRYHKYDSVSDPKKFVQPEIASFGDVTIGDFIVFSLSDRRIQLVILR